MKNDINVVILTHGEFGESLVQSMKMIIGEVKDIYSFSLKKDMSIGDLIEVVETKIKAFGKYTVILTDLFGGTPNNVAMYLKQKYYCEVISGVNLPMLIDLIISRDNSTKSLEEMLDDCVNSGKLSIIRQKLSEVVFED